MKTGFALKFALKNITKNKRLFIPYILCGAGLFMVFYIMLAIANDERLKSIKGGAVFAYMMPIAVGIIGILTIILIFYTNSFLMKQRKHELGLYNVLGLEKRHVSVIIFFESFMSMTASIVLGMLLGILLYKMCVLIICKLFTVPSVFGIFYINTDCLILSVVFFALVYGGAFVFNVIVLAGMKPVEMIKSRNEGEKEPKVKWAMFVLGAGFLAAGYYLAIAITNPLKAIGIFFFAVLFVVLGTYFLFAAGSIFILKMLKKNKKFYYSKKHMINVSGLMYRMKQNAVGLASVAVLATGVLIMLSTTVSMYSGINKNLDDMFKYQMYIGAEYSSDDGNVMETVPGEEIERIAKETAQKLNVTIADAVRMHYYSRAATFEDGRFTGDNSGFQNLNVLYYLYIISKDEYEKLTGEKISVSKGETIICEKENNKKAFPESFIMGDEPFDVKFHIQDFPISLYDDNAVDTYGIIVDNDETINNISKALSYEGYEGKITGFADRTAFNFSKDSKLDEKYEDFSELLDNGIIDYIDSRTSSGSVIYESNYWDIKDRMYAEYGSLLFLGIILVVIFMFATSMIIYYKQISEGYEDRERFVIMQNIGMSQSEVKSTIKSQILYMFFIPLAVAFVHVCVAYPLLSRVMRIFRYTDTSSFFMIIAICFVAFAALYTLIYLLTARTYYKIVKK